MPDAARQISAVLVASTFCFFVGYALRLTDDDPCLGLKIQRVPYHENVTCLSLDSTMRAHGDGASCSNDCDRQLHSWHNTDAPGSRRLEEESSERKGITTAKVHCMHTNGSIVEFPCTDEGILIFMNFREGWTSSLTCEDKKMPPLTLQSWIPVEKNEGKNVYYGHLTEYNPEYNPDSFSGQIVSHHCVSFMVDETDPEGYPLITCVGGCTHIATFLRNVFVLNDQQR